MTSNASITLKPVVVGAGLVLSFAIASFTFPTTAAAQEAAPPAGAAPGVLGQGFGAPGQIAIDADLGAGLTKVKQDGWVFTIQPAADYFVIPNVSVGVVLAYSRDNAGSNGEKAGIRAGYTLSFTDHVGIWPRVGITLQHLSPNVGASSTGTFVALELPIMIHIVPHLFFGIGPYYDPRLSSGANVPNTNYGVFSMVGGWF